MTTPRSAEEVAGEILGEQPRSGIRKLAASANGMIATAHHRATDAGVRILAAGGNAFDAAVAAAFALGVCEPAASGLGGQTMMLCHEASRRRTFAIDGSSRAPHRAAPGRVGAEGRRRGHTATTVPSTPAALAYTLKRYGRMSLADVLEPAIEIAKRGFAVTALQRALTRRERKYLRRTAAADVFLVAGRRTPAVGSILRQPVLAKTLRRLARRGIEDFYTGRIARLIHRDMVRNGGLLRMDDLAQIPWPIERRPVSTTFDGMRVMTFPPPGAGRTLIEMLNVMAELPPRLRDFETPRGAVLLAEVIRKANIDRRDRPRDPSFYLQVRERRMVDREYARKISRRLRRRTASSTRGETTHLSVMDRDGNVVALTQSIERVYGACALAPELGFLYNDYLSAFEHEDIRHPYFLRPNAVPWASVAPTIVYRGRRPWLAIGSPGSERITSSILQVLLRLGHLGPLQAVDAPRLHCSIEGTVSIEGPRMRDDIPRALVKHGFEVDERDAYAFYLGCVQLVMRDHREFVGVADPRRDGSAGGPPE